MATKQVFIVAAEPRSETGSSTLQFLVESDSHRLAWQEAREVCRTGRGALMREAHSQSLHEFPIPAGAYTVKRVLSAAPAKRGRPPKLTTEDLRSLAVTRDVKIPPRVRRVIEELLEHAA